MDLHVDIIHGYIFEGTDKEKEKGKSPRLLKPLLKSRRVHTESPLQLLQLVSQSP